MEIRRTTFYLALIIQALNSHNKEVNKNLQLNLINHPINRFIALNNKITLI